VEDVHIVAALGYCNCAKSCRGM